MEITEDNIKEIKNRAIKLWEFCGLKEDKYNKEDYVNIGDDAVNFDFPGDDDCVQVSVDDLINITNNLDTFEEKDDRMVRCANLSQTIIDIEYNWFYDGGVLHEVYETEDFTASIIDEPILIAIRNLRHGCYNNDFWSPCRCYHAIEFRYKEGIQKLSYEKELDEIYRFLFALNMKTDYRIIVSELPDISTDETTEDDYSEENWDDYDFNKEDEIIVHKTIDLPKASPMLKMYLEALSVNDKSLRFLLFYKIIEYISPIIANSLLYKRLESRLNMGIFSNKREDYYNSIVDLVHRFDKSISDSELASTVLVECCDMELTLPYIPDSVWKLMLKNSSLSSINNTISKNRDIKKLKPEDIDKLNVSLGKILYATRNSIVHAKSNYSKTGLECPIDDVGKLNDFMKVVSYAIILYNNNKG